MKISIYKSAHDKTSTDVTDLGIFLDNVKSGFYEDKVQSIRVLKSKIKKSDSAEEIESLKQNVRKLKAKLPTVAISGEFTYGNDASLKAHSGFICMDIDELDDPEATIDLLSKDDHVYAAFKSCGGYGVAAIFRINGSKHKEAFYGLAEYLLTTYDIIVDPSGKNVSRGRFVSYDPHMYLNESALKFTKYIPARQRPKKVNKKYVFVQSDFGEILTAIGNSGIDVAGNYMNWIMIGFAFADKFGEQGREYFRHISNYRFGAQAATDKLIDRQYTACMKSGGQGATMSTFYWLVKQAGIKTYSTETREIANSIRSQKRSRQSDEDIIRTLTEIGGFDAEVVNEILPQVDASTILDEVPLVEEVASDLRALYNLRRNVISRRIELLKEDGWVDLEDYMENSIYLKIAAGIPKASSQLVSKVINSEGTKNYNPILSFISDNISINTTGNIEKLSNCITSDYGLDGPDRLLFIKKWLVGMMSSIHGTHSPLMLILAGDKQNTGKTEFCRRILPKPLKKYFAESKFDQRNEADLVTTMSENIIVFNDEFGGNTVKDAEKLKAMLSTQESKVRVAYGRHNERFKRIAVFLGSSNNYNILNDPTGNRRLIPIHVSEIDQDAYNSIDKTELFMEAYHLWTSGFEWQLSRMDILKLNVNSDKFESVSLEAELFTAHFESPENDEDGKWFTTSDIIVVIETRTRQKLSIKKLGAAIQKMGINKQNFTRNDKTRAKGYKLNKLSETDDRDVKEKIAQNDVYDLPEDSDPILYPDEKCPF